MTASRSAALLRAALPQIPSHGFTLAAVVAGARHLPNDFYRGRPTPQSGGDDTDLLRGTIGALFPGPPTARTSVERTLFSAWDRDACAQAFEAKEVELRNGPSGGGGGGGSPEDASSAGLQTVTAMLQRRLASNDPVRDYLLKAFALESAHPLPLPSLPSSVQTALPFLRLLPQHPALPDPLPLLSRAGRIADEACRSPLVSQAWRQSLDGPEWYAIRARLAFAYLAGELHLLSPSSTLASSQDLLRRLAQRPALLDALSTTSGNVRSFLEWGGRSWIGILRSRGL
ncbi:unnamed protein product [Tilletia controversa]|nr:unnamed protein product [Tilletia controversa]CAD6947234.1 unnamed protein product [Tilletia controversa]CAD6977653.1 unnamed protein product [Tilletia controversa]CAD6977789.1 unnamed protein product [Tilletia controversa]